MESSDMKNMVVLKNLPSNMVEEAIIIFKENHKNHGKKMKKDKYGYCQNYIKMKYWMCMLARM